MDVCMYHLPSPNSKSTTGSAVSVVCIAALYPRLLMYELQMAGRGICIGTTEWQGRDRRG